MAGGNNRAGYDGGTPPEETPDTCDVCTLLQFIAEEVISIKRRLNLFEAQARRL